MKEHSIIFSPLMVQAILCDAKWMTRRIIKPQPIEHNSEIRMPIPLEDYVKKLSGLQKKGFERVITAGPVSGYMVPKCPYGNIGDVLWVRESFAKIWDTDHWFDEDTEKWIGNFHWEYKADDLRVKYPGNWDDAIDPKSDPDCAHWGPSIHMPYEACRLKLLIKSIRVERLQDITDEDALAEGCLSKQNSFVEGELRDAFKKLWSKINGPDSWIENPWVWVIEFERIKL